MSPEVGKIGNNSPTFIEPVAERSDGIKSFFNKQQPSPAKKVEEPLSPPRSVKEEESHTRPHKAEMKSEAEGIDTKVTEQDEEKGLGDDSNAPNPGATEEEKPSIKGEASGKRKRGPADVDVSNKEQEEEEMKPEKRGGHQTKVVRRTPSDDTNKAVSCLGREASRIRDSYRLLSNRQSPASSNHLKR